MRSLGLTLCLLASSLGARAESVEDRITTLEARVKALEQALRSQGDKTALSAGSVEGSYKATLAEGKTMVIDLKNGQAVAAIGDQTKTGTYQVIGQSVVISVDGKSESLSIDGDHLRAEKGNEKIDFAKIK